VKPKQPAGPAMALGNLRELGVQRGGTEPLRPRGMHKRTYQRILGMLAYHGAIRKQGASYPRKYRPDQHRAHGGGSVETDLRSLVDGQSANLQQTQQVEKRDDRRKMGK